MKEISEFLESPNVKAMTPKSQEKYKYALTSFETFLKKNNSEKRNLTYISKRLPAFSLYLKKQGKSGNSTQQYITIVKIFLKTYGVTSDFQYRITSEEKKALQFKKINRWFNDNDIQKCLKYSFPDVIDYEIKTRNKLLVRLLCETGARIHEITNISFGDFDTDNCTVFLQDSKTEPRPAFYSDETKKLIDQILLINKFSTKSTKVFKTTDWCKKIIFTMLENLGLKGEKDGRGPHTFRHYVATHLYYNGEMDLNDLATVLGDRPDTIRNEYLHPTPEMLRKRVVKAWGWN